MKKLVNDVHTAICEILGDFILAHPDPVNAHCLPDFVTCHVPKAEGKVGLVSGSGSGHKPLHTGFVDEGMLDAAVPGAVFIPPTLDPILEATKAADHGVGMPHIVKNYTDDVLNSETATELADMEDIKVSSVVVGGDMAVEDSLYMAGCRGVAGTIFVEKIAGAAAECSDPLEEVTRTATKVSDQTRSMGPTLGPYTVPHASRPSFDLGEDEIELGIGIRGELGYRRSTVETVDDLVAEFYGRVYEDLGLAGGERVVALVNGVGGTPVFELYICFRALTALLKKGGIKTAHQMVSNYIINLEMSGASVTPTRADNELLELFDAPVNTIA